MLFYDDRFLRLLIIISDTKNNMVKKNFIVYSFMCLIVGWRSNNNGDQGNYSNFVNLGDVFSTQSLLINKCCFSQQLQNDLLPQCSAKEYFCYVFFTYFLHVFNHFLE